MRQAFAALEVVVPGRGLHEITREVEAAVGASGISDGLVTVFIRHTSASLVIQENADPDVRADLEDFLCRVVPEDPSLYRHVAEGPDDMPAHIRAALTATSLSIPLRAGRMRLGTWQGIYVMEHRRGRQHREVDVQVTGD